MSDLLKQIKEDYDKHTGEDIPEEQAIRFAHEMYEYILIVFGEVPKQIHDVVLLHFEEMFKRALRNNKDFK